MGGGPVVSDALMAGAEASFGSLPAEQAADREAITEEEAAILTASQLAETDLMRDREDILFVVNTWLEENKSGQVADFQRWLTDQQRFAYKSGMLQFPGKRPLTTPMVTSLARFLRERKGIEATAARSWI